MQDQTSHADRLYGEAVEAKETLEFPDNYSTAERLFREAVELGSAGPPQDIRARHVTDYAICLMEMKKSDDARRIVRQTLARIDRTDPATAAMAARLLQCLATIDRNDGQLADAEATLMDAIECTPDTDTTLTVIKAQMRGHLREVQALLGRPDAQLADLMVLLTEYRRQPLAKTGPYNSLLEDICTLHISQERYDDALAIVEEGRALLKEDRGETWIRDQWDDMAATVHRRIRNRR